MAFQGGGREVALSLRSQVQIRNHMILCYKQYYYLKETTTSGRYTTPIGLETIPRVNNSFLGALKLWFISARRRRYRV